MTGGLGLTGQDRLIEVKIGRRQQRPVRDQLIARLHDHDIVVDELIRRKLTGAPIAPNPRRRRDQQRETIQCPLRPHLLDDPDRRVRHDDAEEQGIARVAEDERQCPEDSQDEVERSQDDARVGPTRLRPAPGQAPSPASAPPRPHSIPPGRVLDPATAGRRRLPIRRRPSVPGPSCGDRPPRRALGVTERRECPHDHHVSDQQR